MAIWFINGALGNVLVIVISLVQISNQAIVFFLYTGMMAVIFIVFVILARSYKYVTLEEAEENKPI